VQRFQALQLHRDNSDELIKVGHTTSKVHHLITILGFVVIL
jgi:hypothetical protein